MTGIFWETNERRLLFRMANEHASVPALTGERHAVTCGVWLLLDSAMSNIVDELNTPLPDKGNQAEKRHQTSKIAGNGTLRTNELGQPPKPRRGPCYSYPRLDPTIYKDNKARIPTTPR